MENKAKNVSLIGQIVGAVWIAGICGFMFIYKVLHNQQVEVQDVLLSGIALVACFCPVYLSIILDKIKSIRFGEPNGGSEHD